MPAKISEETTRNKICVDIIGPYKIRRKGKDTLILKSVTMIYPITWWFEITQYNGNKATMITNLVEATWLVQYPCTVEIIYERGGELLGYGFKHSLIEQEYGIKTNPDPPRNPHAKLNI